MGFTVALGQGYRTITIAIVIGTWAPVARFVSARVVEINNLDFVNSARVIGARRLRVIMV